MASTTPVIDTPVPAAAPVLAPASVKVDAAPAAKAESVPARVAEAVKAAVAPVAKAAEKIVEQVAAPVAKAVEKAAPKIEAPVAAKNPAPATPPVAKKKAVAKAVPKVAVNTVNTVKTLVAPAVAKAKTVAAKEVNIMEATIKNAADKAKTLMSDANAKSTQAFGEMNDFTKGNIEAIVESGKIAAKGVEAMGQDAAEYSRKQFESATAALKTLSTVKSPTDFFKLQSDYMRTSFDSLVAQSSKNTEAFLKLAGEVAQPIQNRVSIAVEKVKIAA